MQTTIAIAAPGEMGSSVGERLARHGARVMTSLIGRSARSAERAAMAGLVGASDAQMAAADFFLSIAPPKDALAIAERYAQAAAGQTRKCVYIDCNAVSVQTTVSISRCMEAAGARYVDASIIGRPGRPNEIGPTFYLSGEWPADVATLSSLGLRVRSTRGPIGAASALKMAYAGLNKGLTGLAAAMVLAATRAGAARALHDELAESQPQLLAHIGHTLPDMYAKAYRWEFEMLEVSRFAGPDAHVGRIFDGMAGLFATLAADWRSGQEGSASIEAFLGRGQDDVSGA
jgi:3-hydroxyisobutyrate dehydrogenase-like beta-hydroxyacid dehydrogenase